MTDFSVELVAADGSRIPLGEEQQVGRTDECDITIDDGRVSRKHALLRIQGQTVSVEDLGSANGTSVNGLPARGVVELADGDAVSFDKHRYVLAITGAEPDADATVVGMDANADADADATMVAPVEADTEPSEVEAPASAKAAPDLPGSWVDSGTSDKTRVLSMDAVAEAGSPAALTERASDLPHLIVLVADGSPGGVLELQTTAAQDVWEIGREPPCEIVLKEDSVSERHAQLIHQDGRWQLVNLVSTNGIFVNGEKKLSAYLADGDEIRLGLVTLVFRAAEGAIAEAPSSAAKPDVSSSAAADSGDRKTPLGMAATLAFLVLVILVAWMMM